MIEPRMELHLSAKKEATLQDFAARTGRNAADVIEEGDLSEREEVVERIELTRSNANMPRN
ncbi:MAG TPA: hypothetical protein VHC90_23330 [Bryobacteraceae bacterium]|nr:hypothetical protein [Bryobacteraceae bacterium]